MTDKRPPLDKKISSKDFKEFYWMKAELQSFCKSESIPQTGSKIELAERIIQYLETGTNPEIKKTTKRSLSKFDWQNEELSLKTVITDNYKNTENVREFFSKHLGSSFKFNVKFMQWMKSNLGKTLGDAINAWKEIKMQNKLSTTKKDIAPQFEYNTYLRDFLLANPTMSRSIGIKLWKIKKTMRGNNVYQKADLKFLE